jgi:hypothetical protein
MLRQTRRHFFKECAVGLGGLALLSLLSGERRHDRLGDRAGDGPPLDEPAGGPARGPDGVPPRTHFPARATSVIYLFMAGGPSQLDLFDYKPQLQARDGQPVPASFLRGRRFAFMDLFTMSVPKLLGSKRRFRRHGQSGAHVSECLPHTAEVVDDLAFVHAVSTDVFNHTPATLFASTGSAQPGRPSMGSWVTYGLGSEAQDLPGFVVLQSGEGGVCGGTPNWGAGFLPAQYQGTPFRAAREPILGLNSPPGVTPRRQRQTIDAIRDLNAARLLDTEDPEIAARIASYEMAYRMQTSAPELVDLGGEDARTLEMYGARPGQPSFAANCLLARRLVERGVRFVQLYHTGWDHHGTGPANLDGGLDRLCQETDRPAAALVRDLKQRGLLDNTLVVWGGEFGRTPMGEPRDQRGRNHHIEAGTMWLAGGGARPGTTLGATDELGFASAGDRIHMHDIQATILHLLGLDHTRLTFRFQGRDFRLTDVAGEVLSGLVA